MGAKIEKHGEPDKIYDKGSGLLTLIRKFKVSGKYTTKAQLEGSEVHLPYETPDAEHTDCLLMDQRIDGSESTDAQKSILVRTYVQLPTDVATLVKIGSDVIIYGETGLGQVEQRFAARKGHVLAGAVGSKGGVGDGDAEGFYLAGNGFAERGKVSAVVVKRWSEAGILDTSHQFDKGLLYVTFTSQGTRHVPTCLADGKSLTDPENEAFVGGAAANIRASKTKDVEGFRKFTVTVFMKSNGDPLLDDADNEISSRQKYVPYTMPGLLTLSSDTVMSSPPVRGTVLAQITEYLSRDSELDPSFKPFNVNRWADYNYSYLPSETKVAVYKSGAASGYLGQGSFAAIGGKVFGMDSIVATGTCSSDPSPAQYQALTDQVIDSDNEDAFTTDEGVKWYRKFKVQAVGTFISYFNATYTATIPPPE